MKKVISIVLALVMMMAVMVPVFAAEQTVNTEGQYDALVKTDTSNVTGDGTYSVSYPATMDIKWEQEGATSFFYTVSSQLKADKRVNVQITDVANEYKMVNADGDYIVYALGGTTNGTTLTPVTDNVQFDYSITVDDWTGVPIDAYQDTLTFTVSIVNA